MIWLEKKTYEGGSICVYLRNAVAIWLYFVMLFCFLKPGENKIFRKTNLCWTCLVKLFEQIEKQSVASSNSVSIKSRGTQQQVQTSAPKITVDKAKTSRPIAV